MANQPVVLILGAGPRIGVNLVTKFLSIGYRVAVASRSGGGTKDVKGIHTISADFAKPDSIATIFADVEAAFHTAPSVVIYNAAALTNPPDSASIFSVPAQNVASDLKVNTVSPYIAAQEAVKAWETLPKDTQKTFIYTGNITSVVVLPMPMMMNLGMGKSASAYWVGLADMTLSAKGYRFFYADERQPDGKIKGPELDGAAHGEFYAQLVSQSKDIPWHATFVKGKGYVPFN